MDFSFYSAPRYRAFLDEMISKAEYSYNNGPEGTLVIKHKNRQTWYCEQIKNMGTQTTYISSKNTKYIASLAQKGYDRQILNLLKNALKSFKATGAILSPTAIDDVFYSLSPERQVLVIPIIPTDKQYTQAWTAQPFEGLPFNENDSSNFYASDNRRLRSKAEVIIAESFIQYGLPNKYECPLVLGNEKIYPDFTILDIRTRQEKYFEHFGMMDNPEQSLNLLN